MGSGTGYGGKGGMMSNVIQQISAQNPQQQANNFSYNQTQPNQYNVDYAKYTSQPINQSTARPVNGEAFNSGVNSDSGIASIIAGLYSSGIFNQQNTNPYAPQGTVGSFNSIPYGQQQESMFSRNGLSAQPYGGYQGQSWNPYGNYYTTSNPIGNTTNSNIAPPPRTTGPDALQQLSFMMNRNNTQI